MSYLFEDHVLDTDRRELRRGKDIVPVTPQVFDLLEFLIRCRERVASKDELVAAICGGRIVTDSALTTRINAARRAIGDSGKEQRLIRTLARRGFRFVGRVREIAEPAATLPFAEMPGKTSPLLLDHGGPCIAVFHFADVSVAEDRPLYGHWIAEDMVVQLSKLHGLQVIAAGSCSPRDGHPDWARQWGRELGARYLLDGSVRWTGDTVRITGRLVDSTTGAHLWVERYDRRRSATLYVHDEMTRIIASAVTRVILRAEQRRALQTRREDMGAWEAYQSGMWHMSMCEPAENNVARTYFQRSIEIDPGYAPGLGALAWSFMYSASIYSEMSVAESCELGESLVRKAIALDEQDPQSRARLALVFLLTGDMEGAIQEARLILSAHGDCADAQGVLGAALMYSGHRSAGRQVIHRYLRLKQFDPARPIRLAQLSGSLYLDGDYEAAAATAKRVIRHYPRHPLAYRWLAASLGQLGRTESARSVLRTLEETSPSSFDMYVRRPPPSFCIAEYKPMLQGLHKAGWRE